MIKMPGLYTNNNNNNIPYQSMLPSPYPNDTRIFQFQTQWTMRQKDLLIKIKDPSKNVVFTAEEKVFHWGLYYRLFDTENGALVGKIKSKIQGLLKFSIILDGTEYAIIKLRVLGIKIAKIQFTNDNDVPISIEGNWLRHVYTFKRGEQIVATLTKGWLIHRNKYTVDIEAGENVLCILSCCILIHRFSLNIV